MKLLEKLQSAMTDGIGTFTESSMDILVNINNKGALLESVCKESEDEEKECKETDEKCNDEKECEDKKECEDDKKEDCEGEDCDEEGADEEIEESEIELKSLPEMIDENMMITLYSLNEEMTEVVEEKVNFIVTEEAEEEEEEVTEEDLEKEAKKDPKRPLKFLLLASAKNLKLENLKKVGKVRKILTKMVTKATKLDHVNYLEKDRKTTLSILKDKKEDLYSYGLQAKIDKLIEWLEGNYKRAIDAKRENILAIKDINKESEDKQESVAENFLTKLYSYDEETDSLVESMAIVNEDELEDIQESGKYFTKVMAVVEANLNEKVDSIVANMKSAIAKADKFKLEKMQRDLPVTIAKTNVKKQKAIKKGNTEKAKEYDRLINYLRSGAPNDIKARIRVVQTLKEAAELGIKCEMPEVEKCQEDLGFDAALKELEAKDAISVLMQYKALDNDGDTDVTAKEADKKLPNEVAGEENNGTEGYHPESVPTITTEAKCNQEGAEEVECTGEDECACEACNKEKQRKQAIKEARCKK